MVSHINKMEKLGFKISKYEGHYQNCECDSYVVEPYKCQYCDFENDFIVNLYCHMAVTHRGKGVNSTKGRPFKCYKCGKCEFRTYSVLVMLKHHILGHVSTSYTSRRREIRCVITFTKTKWFKCDQCSFRTKLQIALGKHIETHVPPCCSLLEKYGCQYCQFEVKMKVILKNHMYVCHEGEEKKINTTVKHEEKYYKCANCHFQTYSLFVLMKHATNSGFRRRFQCEDCCYQSNYRYHLKAHISAKHADPNEVHWFQCDRCAYKSQRKDSLQQHTILKHVDGEHIAWIKCEHCSFQCKLKKRLASHVKREHQEHGSVWYQCDHCSFQTKYKNNLEGHTSIKHTDLNGITWLKCGECSYEAKYKTHLKKHIKEKHTIAEEQEELSQCEQCSYKAPTKYVLKRHVLYRHTDSKYIKWLFCEQCSFKCKQRCQLISHMKKHADPEALVWYHCEECAFKTVWKYSLRKHVKRIHLKHSL